MKIVQMYTKINTTLVSLPSILSLLSEVALPGESIATWWCNVRTPSLKHRGVGRHLAHRKDKRKCLWNRGPRSTVNISDEKVFGPGLLHLCKGAAITSGRCSKMARRRTPPEAINVRMSFIEPNMTYCDHQTTQIWTRWNMLFGERFRRWFTTAEVSSLCKN